MSGLAAGERPSGERPFTVREYRPGDERGILALFNRTFAIGNPDFAPRTLAHWRWAFPRNPEGHTTMVAEADGASGREIVGTFTCMPSRFRFEDGAFRLGQAVDTVIAPESRASLRKSGVYLTLSYAFYERFGKRDDLRLLYGFPNPQAFRVGTKFGGYEPVRCPVVEQELPLAAAAGWNRDERIAVAEVEEFGGELDRLDAALARKGVVASLRTAKVWNWRYAECPSTSYRLLRAEGQDGRLRGFLVHGFSWHAFRKEIVPIVDWVIAPGDLATWRALLGAAARAGAAHPAPKLTHLLAWTAPAQPWFADLAALGFTPRDSIFNLCIRRFEGSDYAPEQARDGLQIVMGDSDIW